MNNSTALFACSKCFKRYPFEDLSSGQQLCKECRGSYPIVKCTYCRSEFQQMNKVNTSTICNKCEHNVKLYGKPSACENCNIIAAFIGSKCQRCTNSEKKYGPPVTCEQCKQKCAFDRKDDDKKVDGKLLCWLCTLSFKRALAKTKQSDAERKAHMKMVAQKANKNKEPKLRSHNKRPQRPDVTKMAANQDGSAPQGGGPTPDGGQPPPNKMARGSGGHHHHHRTHHHPGDPLDPNSSDHVVAMTQLKEQMASLQKQLAQKDSLILSKDKMITELKAKFFTAEQELRGRMNSEQKDFEKKMEMMASKIKTLQKEVVTLSKSSGKKTSLGGAAAAAAAAAKESSNNSGSGTDSPSIT
ncbi:protein FAM76A isoform X2 [Nilaparvata lugens]|uniref:protein FAM76A isoform X1 n=1 Tax=Nilaparvata lugens TaxID=108931 RepID=UPI00193CC977|nr:protein FAM76A isoform X1 [Nilaparvata lugens]XP_039293388.1 protein FAM76A isoform X2 [Nilaparvata lugens]